MKQWFASRIGLLAAAGTLAFVLGCAPGAQPAQPAEKPAVETPKYGGILELAQTATPADTDVNMYSCCPAYWTLVSNRLIDSDPYNLELKPALLEKWQLASDGLSVEFKVRQGVKYQNVAPVNGREMTAEDIAFNLRRAAGMENPKNLSITNWPRASILGAMKDAVATDKYTVKVTLKQPDAGFIVGVADFRNMVFAPEVVKQYGDLRNTEKTTIGVGPFILTKWQSGVVTEFKKNPDYWQKDERGNPLPYLDGVRFTNIADKTTTMAALRAKQLDMWVGGIPQNHEDLKKTNPELQWHMALGGCCANVGPGLMVKRKPMDDIRVRKALHLLLDRRAISDAEFGGKDTYNKYWFYAAPVGIYLKDYTLSQEEISKLPGWRQPKDQDVAEAKKLLTEAGYPTGFTWIMDTNPAATGSLSGDGDGCPLVQGQFKRDYVDTKILPDMKVECFPREGPLQFKANVEFAHEMSFWWSYAHEYDPGLQLHQIYGCNGSRNYTQGCDDKWTQKWEAQQKEFDLKKRAELLKDLQRYTIEQYWTLLVWSYNQHTSAQPYVKGIQQWIGPFSGTPADYYARHLWLDK